MSKATIPSRLGDVEFDCIISREASYAADVPDYVLEGGAYTSDTVMRKPVELSVKALITNSPVSWYSSHVGLNRVNEVRDKLIDMYMAGELYEFTTPDNVYENMAITSITFPEDDYLNAIEITLNLKQVRITTPVTILVEEYDYSGDSEASAGTTATDEEKGSSILNSLFGWLFDLF